MHEVARRRERQAEAGDRALQRADHRMRHPLQVLDRRVQPLDDPLEIGLPLRGFDGEPRRERLQVAARHEVLAGALAARRPAASCRRRASSRGRRAHPSSQVEHVQRRRPIERQRAPPRRRASAASFRRASFVVVLGHADSLRLRRFAANRRETDCPPRARRSNARRRRAPARNSRRWRSQTRDRRSRAASAWRPGSSPRASLCTPCAPPSKHAMPRSMQNSIAW